MYTSMQIKTITKAVGISAVQLLCILSAGKSIEIANNWNAVEVIEMTPLFT